MRTHYCKSCKREVPIAPGTGIDPYYTVGVAHAISLPNWIYPCVNSVHRTYNREEQERNLEGMEL